MEAPENQTEKYPTVEGLTVTGSDPIKPILQTLKDNTISFNQACCFRGAVEFNNGGTIIGKETTYNSPYVGSPTIQAGIRLVVGDSSFKIDNPSRSIIADTFT